MLVEPNKTQWVIFRDWWLGMQPFTFVLFTNGLMIGLAMVMTPILLLLGMEETTDIGGPDFSEYSTPMIIVLAVIVAPLLETLIFQLLPIEVFKKWVDIRLLIIFSAIIFALAHVEYSYWYAFLIFPMGIVLAYIYYAYKHPIANGYWITTIVHAFRNMIALIPILFNLE